MKQYAQDIIEEIVYQTRKVTKPINIIRRKYKKNVGYELDLENPRSFNEKLQWLKLYDNNPNYTNIVDKYEVRNYIENTIGEEYLIPLIGLYEKFEDINFDKLPNQFVLKCTHDSGGIVICKDKKELDIDSAKRILNKCLKRNYYYYSMEWPYKDVKPRIVCEKYMVDESGTELKDYKIFCFNGEPKFIQVDFNRFVNHKRNFYDNEWNLLEFSLQYPNDPNVQIKKPSKLNEMLKMAKKLANSYPFTRIDFYSIEGEIYFGEITFFPGSGYERFEPKAMDSEIGKLLKLPQ